MATNQTAFLLGVVVVFFGMLLLFQVTGNKLSTIEINFVFVKNN